MSSEVSERLVIPYDKHIHTLGDNNRVAFISENKVEYIVLLNKGRLQVVNSAILAKVCGEVTLGKEAMNSIGYWVGEQEQPEGILESIRRNER